MTLHNVLNSFVSLQSTSGASAWFKDYGTALAGFLTLAVLLAALIYAVKQLRSMEKYRHSELILRLSQRWESDAMRQSREAVGGVQIQGGNLAKTIEHAAGHDPAYHIKLIMVADLFEDIGFLLKWKYLDPPKLVMELFSNHIEAYYERYLPYIRDVRTTQERENIYEWFEYAYNEAVNYRAKRASKGGNS